MQVRFCIDNAVRGTLFRAGQEFPDVVEADVPLTELDPDTRSYLWELSGEGMHRLLTLRVPQWDEEVGRRHEVAWGVPLVPTSASEWKELLMAYRAAARAAEETTMIAEEAAWTALVRRAWRWVWIAPVMVSVIVLVAAYVLSSVPNIFDNPESFMLRTTSIFVAILFAGIFSTVWIQSILTVWEDRRRRREQEGVHSKVAA